MPTLSEREAIGNLDPKNFYKDYVPPEKKQTQAEQNEEAQA